MLFNAVKRGGLGGPLERREQVEGPVAPTEAFRPEPNKQGIIEYAQKLEMDAWRQAEYQITAAGFWGNFQWLVGGIASALAAAASGTAFSDLPVIAGSLALVGAAAAAVLTSIRPGDLSSAHATSAAAYHRLQIGAMEFWEFDIAEMDLEKARLKVHQLNEVWCETSTTSPRVPRRLYRVSDKNYVSQNMPYFPPPGRLSVEVASKQ